MSTLYNGYVESDEQVALRWQRIKAREYAFDVYGAELTDEEADALRAALILCATDPAHILNTAQEVDDWMQRDDAAAQYGNAWLEHARKREHQFNVHYYKNGGRPYFKHQSGGDDDMPF